MERSERTSQQPTVVGDTAGAPEIVSSDPSSFPWSVWHERHPVLVRQLLEGTPYGPAERRAVEDLLAETSDGVIEPLPPDAHGRELWHGAWDRDHYGKRWTDAPFLWAESYFYRRLRLATGHDADGPWRGVDFFAPMKGAELASSTVDDELAALDELGAPSGDALTGALLHASLWGNRADLGFRMTAGDAEKGAAGDASRLVADDRARLKELLRAAAERPGRIVLVADNAGRELIPDLVLVDHLLTTGAAAEVVLHVKPYPYYVSDATPEDVLAALRRLARASGRASAVGERLWRAAEEGRLLPRAHQFSCAPLPYSDMPDDLRQDFAAASLTLFKGDLNYRRLVGDRHWPATTPFAEVTTYFPGPVAALRTLKSDVVTGIDEEVAASLDATGAPWRTDGQRALVQVRP